MPFDPKTGAYVSMDDWRKARAPAAPAPSTVAVPEPAAPEKKSLFGKVADVAQQLGVSGLRSVTFGLSDKVLKPLGDVLGVDYMKPPETAAEKAAAFVGEMGGALVPLGVAGKAASAGIRLAGTAAQKIAPNVVAKAALSPAVTKALAGLRAIGEPALTGVIYEGTKAAVEGKSPSEVATAAGRGAAFFGAAGVAGRIVGAGLEKAVPPAVAASRLGRAATGAVRGTASGLVGAAAQAATYPAGERPTGKDIAMTGAQLGAFEAVMGGLSGGKLSPSAMKAVAAMRGQKVEAPAEPRRPRDVAEQVFDEMNETFKGAPPRQKAPQKAPTAVATPTPTAASFKDGDIVYSPRRQRYGRVANGGDTPNGFVSVRWDRGPGTLPDLSDVRPELLQKTSEMPPAPPVDESVPEEVRVNRRYLLDAEDQLANERDRLAITTSSVGREYYQRQIDYLEKSIASMKAILAKHGQVAPQAPAPVEPAKSAEAPAPAASIGRRWPSPEGEREVVEVVSADGKPQLRIKTEGSDYAWDVIPPDSLEGIIKMDALKLERAQTKQGGEAAPVTPPVEATVGTPAKAKEPWEMTRGEFKRQAVQRIEEKGVTTRATAAKPHGIYTTPLEYESPHQELGGDTFLWLRNPEAKVLRADTDKLVRTNRGLVGKSAGIAALEKLVGQEEAARLLALPKAEVVKFLSERYPDVEWTRYYDAQEALEGYAGLLARKAGYDAIYSFDKVDPSLSEYVGLTEKALTPVTDHASVVKQALAAGKPVPPEVLAEYPDLAAKATPPAAPASRAVAALRKLDTLEPSLVAEQEAPSRVSEKAGPQTVQTRSLIPAQELSDAEIAQRIKAQFPNEARQSSYSRYVQALDLSPRIPAAEFFKLYDGVGPNWHYRTENVAFQATHTDTVTGMPVAATKANGYHKLLWQDGRTGGEPGETLPERYRPVNTSPAAEVAAPEAMPVATGTSKAATLNAPPGVPQGVSAAGRTTITPGTVRAIVNTLGRLGAPIRVGRTGGARGIFKVRPEVIRTKMAQDIPVIAHEVGHHLDKTLGLSGNPAFQKELVGLARAAGAKENLNKEGVAEYVRLYITDPVKAQQMAPTFAKHFEQVLAGNKAVTDSLDAARQQIKDIVGAQPEEFMKSIVSVGEKPKPRPTTLRQMYARFIDELDPIRRAVATVTGGQQLSATEDPYTQARLGRAWAGKASAALNNGVRDAAGREMAPALKTVLKPVVKNLDDFRAYLVAKHILEIEKTIDVLPGQGIVGRDGVLERARATVQKFDTQVFRDAAKNLSDYQDALLRTTLVDSGMLSEEAANQFLAKFPSYVPFYRVFEEAGVIGQSSGMGKGFMDLQKAIKKMRGSSRPVVDPIESVIKNTYLFTNLAEKNRVARLLADLADKHEGIGQFIEAVAPKLRATEFSLEEIRGVLQASGVDLQGVNLDAAATVFRPMLQGSLREGVATVWRGGKAHLYEFDPDIYEAMKWLDRDGMGKLVDVLHYPAAWLRAGAVQFNPVFLGFNPIRDNVSAAIYSKYGFVPGFDFVKGLFHVIKKDEMYELFQSSGAAQSSFVSLDRNFLQKDLRSLLGGKKGIHPLEWLQTLSEAMEQSTRLGEFAKAVKKEGLTREGLAKSALAAREVTLDFSRSGSWTHGMNRITAFFNANLQGTDKMVRAFTERPMQSTLKAAAIITLPSIALYLVNRNNPYYRELSEYEKDYYWHIPVGKSIDVLDGKADGFLRIPKPFELGILFGALPERVLTWMDEKERGAVDAFAKEMKPWLGSFINGLTPSVVPTAATFPVEYFANRDLFQGRQIVPDREKDLPKELQFGPYTSEVSKLVGKAFNVTPRYFDQFIRDYFGGMGGVATDITDGVLRAAGLTEGEIKAVGNQIPLVTSFYARPYAGTSDSIEHFYEVWNRAEAVFNGRQARLKQNLQLNPLTPEEAELIGGLNTLRAVGSALSDLRAIQRTAMFSPNLTPQERRAVKDYLDYYQINYARFLQGLPLLTLPDEDTAAAERVLPGVVQEQKMTQQRLKAMSQQLRSIK